MENFDSLAEQDWRIIADEYEPNEPMICYPDPEVRDRLVGPIAKVHIGATVEGEDGEEVWDLSGPDGRNLYAIACLPQVAKLFRWIDSCYSRLGTSESTEFNLFVDELKSRIDWIKACIDERENEVSATEGKVKFFPSH